ncbi:electron transfer flavoprotein beta subunit [Cryobacterium flavum]|uniref:Electron transfer flavoprotein subunit beta n=1 Tax=Cryobacterium flavum TaxID=1424659 RepID=A0A4R8UX76_9MICO|nr:electron transfer flavoprotein subunit beta/FixA family protein [Cryobacterium flavum]TFB73610.1 electron transfer flavoprotein subunit beta/FixA family protein [Cryobacterium flavum]SDO32844.1 electron transfer flavoprotein beta subunit [Cryobacterium flavum]
MKILVLVKQVPDTWGERSLDSVTGALIRTTGEQVIDEIDERALEVALQYKDATNAEVVAVTMGPARAIDVLRKSLAMGADSGIHLVDDSLAGSDLGWTARALAGVIALDGFDLVIAGNESTDGRGGVIPAMIAEHLGVPNATFLDTVTIAPNSVAGERATDYGTVDVSASLPAVISITERSAEPRFPSFRGILGAKKKPVKTISLSDLQLDSEPSRSLVHSTSKRPPHSAGTKVIDAGDAGMQLAKFLADNRLI